MVFLDKCCIPQKDPIAKSYGISRLADYLHASDTLLILWSPDYLDRLWCVYELAVFLQTHDKEDVVLVNLDHLNLCVSMMFLQFFSTAIASLAEPYYVDVWYILYVLLLTSSLLTDFGAYRCSEEWQKFCSEVRSFTLRKAKCSSLADYPILKQLIVDMYGSETRFEAAVRALWLGERRERQCPAWLFSAASLRIICASYIPLILGRAVGAIARSSEEDTVSLQPIFSTEVDSETNVPDNVQCKFRCVRRRMKHDFGSTESSL
ncbi:hypothetical protein FOZ61_006115 [Perkinsus olseni]|uniref:TIR domain-containing protein n=1 Tax=Perkinsus olseni TaxID=32597 RepID=A0A7J6LEU9_PEROL|nr:hypothetical protein FOZ61_006115 [Perkinsus olseni]KAF4662056.1 hypothetical protein FOL46_005487 [Perkinsus olseni]